MEVWPFAFRPLPLRFRPGLRNKLGKHRQRVCHRHPHLRARRNTHRSRSRLSGDAMHDRLFSALEDPLRCGLRVLRHRARFTPRQRLQPGRLAATGVIQNQGEVSRHRRGRGIQSFQPRKLRQLRRCGNQRPDARQRSAERQRLWQSDRIRRSTLRISGTIPAVHRAFLLLTVG